MEKKEYVLFSHDDLDGGSPQFIARALLGDQLVYSRLCGYHNIDEEILSYLESDIYSPEHVIFITDIRINDEVAEKLQELYENGQKICLLDHHVTNLYLNNYEWASVIPEKHGVKQSATSLFYEFLTFDGAGNPIAEPNSFLESYAEAVRKYDTWDWYEENDMLAHDLNMLYFLVSTKVMEDFVIRGSKELEVFDSIPEEFDLLMEVEKKRIERFCHSKLKTIRWITLFGRKTAVIYLDQYHPYVAEAVQEKHPETDVICMIDVSREKVSLRSRKDEIDVVDIAEYFGGGGHPKAAGFSIPAENFYDFVFHSERKDISSDM